MHYARIIILICLCAAAMPAVMGSDVPAADTFGGTISVFSYPANASVTLDGEYRGATPLVLRNVPPGEYTVGISLAGFRNESFTLRLQNGSTRDIGVNLEDASIPAGLPGNGSVAVDSVPGGAAVTLDGKQVGKTPEGHAALILDGIPAGLHRITVVLSGYPVFSQNVTVPKNRVVQVNADLRPATTTLPETAVPTGTPVPPVNGTVSTVPVPSVSGTEPVPLSPVVVVLSLCVAVLAAAFRRA